MRRNLTSSTCRGLDRSFVGSSIKSTGSTATRPSTRSFASCVSSIRTRPDVVITDPSLRDEILREGRYWIYDDKIVNISDLNKYEPGSFVNLRFAQDDSKIHTRTSNGLNDRRRRRSSKPSGPKEALPSEIFGVGVLSRSASVTVRVLSQDCWHDGKLSKVEKKALSTAETATIDKDIPTIIRDGTAFPPDANCKAEPGGRKTRRVPSSSCEILLDHDIIISETSVMKNLRNAIKKNMSKISGQKPHYCRLINADVDGIPGVIVDRFGEESCIVTYLSLSAHQVFHHALQNVLKEEGIIRIGMHKIETKKEKYSMNGEEFSSTMVKGKPVENMFSVIEENTENTKPENSKPLRCSFNLYHGREGWDYTENGIRCFLSGIAKGGAVLDLWSKNGAFGLKCAAQGGASEVILLEEELNLASATHENVISNELDDICIALHRVSIKNELQSMAAAGVRFDLTIMQFPVKFERFFKHRRGMFGRWYRPDVRGLTDLIKSAAKVTANGGFLAVKFLLPESQKSMAPGYIHVALDLAGKSGSIVKEVVCQSYPRSMLDVWHTRWLVVVIHD